MVRIISLALLMSLVAAETATAAQSTTPPAGAIQSASTAVDGTLAALIAELERSNPEIQAAKSEVDARTARIAPAGALPDPTLSFSTMTGFSRPPFFPAPTTPNAFNQIAISQALPYPGKRPLRTAIAKSDADAGRWNYDDRRRALIADLKLTYLEYVLVVGSLEIVKDNKTLVTQLREAAEARFSVGKALQQDVIKAQVESSMLIERQTLLEQQRGILIAHLNALLFRPSDAPGPGAVSYSADPPPPNTTTLLMRIDANYPALQREATLIEKGRQTLALSQKELRPDFQIGVNAQRYSGDMPWMYGLDVMVGLPIYASKKQRPLITEAAASLTASEHMRDNVRAQATAEVTQAILTATAADRLVSLYSDSVLPQAQLALESSLAAYQAGTVDFLSVLTNFEAVFAAQTSRLEQQIRRDQSLVRLEPYVGIDFVK